jgi:hypothetical protein
MASKNVYQDSAFGVAVHPHVNAPDTKFNPDNPLFKVGLKLTGEAAATQKAKVDAASEAAFKEWMEGDEGSKLTPAERKKFSVYYPYDVEEDPQSGDPTGAIVFHYKQNARIRLKDGTVKNIVIGIYDAKGNEMHKEVWGGSVIRVNYTMRPIPMKSLKQVGVRLDFGRIQVKELSTKQGGGGFGAVEDGYEDDGVAQEGFSAVDQQPGNGDY